MTTQWTNVPRIFGCQAVGYAHYRTGLPRQLELWTIRRYANGNDNPLDTVQQQRMKTKSAAKKGKRRRVNEKAAVSSPPSPSHSFTSVFTVPDSSQSTARNSQRENVLNTSTKFIGFDSTKNMKKEAAMKQKIEKIIRWNNSTEDVVPFTARSPQPPSNISFYEMFKITEPPEVAAPKSPEYAEFSTLLEKYLSSIKDEPGLLASTNKTIPNDVLESVSSWLKLEKPSVAINLPSLSRACRHDNDEDFQSFCPLFQQDIERQQDQFRTKMSFTENHMILVGQLLVDLVDLCRKNVSGKAPVIIWEKAKESGHMNAQFLSSLLLVVSMFHIPHGSDLFGHRIPTGHSILNVLFNDRGNDTLRNEPLSLFDGLQRTDTGLTPSDAGADGPVVNIAEEIAVCHDLLHEPTEQSISTRLRTLASRNELEQAESLLSFGESVKVDMKLRTYACIFHAHLNQGNVASALAFFWRMMTAPSVDLDSDTYTVLLNALAANEYFCVNAKHTIQKLDKETQSSMMVTISGPELFDELMSEMSKAVCDIPLPQAMRLYNGFAQGFPNSTLEKTGSYAQLRVKHERADSSELLVDQVSIDPNTGMCPRSGVKLRLIGLDQKQLDHFRQQILNLAVATQSSYLERERVSSLGSTAAKHLEKFLKWLDERDGKPYTAIIDGPNVAYTLQNYEKGRFSFHQVQSMVDKLTLLGEHPLVIMPAKYAMNTFTTHIGIDSSRGALRQTVNLEEAAIRTHLLESDQLYFAPPGVLDDFCWISASIAKQTKSSQGQELFVPGDNTEGRLPGARPILISNDQMRDHKLELLEPRLFKRWFSNHCVNYEISPYSTSMSMEIGFRPPNVFSREIQGNRAPEGCMVWHIPLEGPPDGTAVNWLCIRIPATKNKD